MWGKKDQNSKKYIDTNCNYKNICILFFMRTKLKDNMQKVKKKKVK